MEVTIIPQSVSVGWVRFKEVRCHDVNCNAVCQLLDPL